MNSIETFETVERRPTSLFGRSSKGQSMFELAAILLVGIPIMLILIDSAVIMMAVATNDAACRDAARAAAGGPPALYAPAENRTVAPGAPPSRRASTILKRIYEPGGYLKILDNVDVRETVKAPVPDSTTGGAIIGEVTVRTTAEVYPPFIVGHIAGELPLKFQKEETYNYTWVRPAGE